MKNAQCTHRQQVCHEEVGVYLLVHHYKQDGQQHWLEGFMVQLLDGCVIICAHFFHRVPVYMCVRLMGVLIWIAVCTTIMHTLAMLGECVQT